MASVEEDAKRKEIAKIENMTKEEAREEEMVKAGEEAKEKESADMNKVAEEEEAAKPQKMVRLEGAAKEKVTEVEEGGEGSKVMGKRKKKVEEETTNDTRIVSARLKEMIAECKERVADCELVVSILTGHPP